MGCCGHLHRLHSGPGGDDGEPRNDLKELHLRLLDNLLNTKTLLRTAV